MSDDDDKRGALLKVRGMVQAPHAGTIAALLLGALLFFAAAVREDRRVAWGVAFALFVVVVAASWIGR